MATRKHQSKERSTPSFRFMNYGGRRPGAGRKPKLHADGSRVEPSHAKRPRFTKSRPLHVTLEVAEGVPSLRSVRLAPIVTDAIGRANCREDFRVVHFCLMGTHIHAICEASGPKALANGMRSLNGTLAKAINKELGRTGRVIAARFDLHVLRTKSEVRNAVDYVLRNAERHGLHEAWPGWLDTPRPDPLSTAAWFPFWAERELLLAPAQIPASAVRQAQCYLMRIAFQGAPLSFAVPVRKASRPRRRPNSRAPSTKFVSARSDGGPPNRAPVPRPGQK